MSLHHSTFQYLMPTSSQKELMTLVREDFDMCARAVSHRLPEGADKTYILRKLRECAMWANVAITREADGSPRKDPA
jgi:hypothetical protein